MTIGILKSKMTVQTMVSPNSKIPDQYLLATNVFIVLHSFIRQAVTIKTPAKAGIGIFDIIGAKTIIDKNKTNAWIIPANLVCAPDLIATLVLAIAAVAGIPPKKGNTKFPIPCATSS